MTLGAPKGQMTKCEYVANALKKMIIAGAYKPGDRLPTESKLCEIFGVSRITVREALKMLSTTGLLDICQGKGTFVKSVDLGVFMKPIYQMINFEEIDIEAIYSAREFIEGGTAYLAAVSRTDSELSVLEELLQKIRGSFLDEDMFKLVGYDSQFHLQIARSAHNPILFACFQTVDEVDSVCKKRFKKYLTVLEGCYAEHLKIYQAIRDKDALAARRAIVAHTLSAKRILL